MLPQNFVYALLPRTTPTRLGNTNIYENMTIYYYKRIINIFFKIHGI